VRAFLFGAAGIDAKNRGCIFQIFIAGFKPTPIVTGVNPGRDDGFQFGFEGAPF
jgi:hypothetical protein